MDRNDSRPVNGPMDEPADDPARQFLDQTVPREDYWEGREPEEGPARPRHVQYPVEHGPPPDPDPMSHDPSGGYGGEIGSGL